MNESDNTVTKPLAGFFPGFYDIGETYPLVKIAKRYHELGGEVVFFSHGGQYEYLAKELDFKIIRFEILKSVSPIDRMGYFFCMDDEELMRFIQREALAFSNVGIKVLVHPNVFFSCILACRLAKIPFISIISGAWTPNYYKQNLGTFPDYLENSFTRVLPQYLKNGVFTRVVNSYLLNRKGPIARKLNRVANKLNINLHFKSAPEMSYGDYTFVCDSMEFLGLKPTKEFPAENYIGPILADAGQVRKSNQLDFDIEKHLQRSGRSILLTMGSSFLMKEIFLRILKTLNQTNYNVIATYTDILKEDEIPMLNDNILLKKFISNINTLNTNVDLAIIHGGRGTVYTAAYSGKPAIGIPSMHEQQANLDSLVRHAMALRLSKKYFSEKNLLVAMETIFNNYDFYLKNAQSLAKKLPKPQGDIKAAKRILQIVTKTSNEEL